MFIFARKFRFFIFVFPLVLSACGVSLSGSSNDVSAPPRLDLKFASAAPSTGVAVSRSGVATYLDSTLTIQNAAPNTPRFEYDLNSNNPAGLLIEPGATNFLPYSAAMGNSFYTASSTGITHASVPNTVSLSPDGTASAVAYTEDNSNGAHGTLFSQVAWSNQVPFSFSVFLKFPANHSAPAVTLSVNNVGAAGKASVTFGSGQGNVGMATTMTWTGAASGVGFFPQSFPNGWIRVAITGMMSTSSGLIPGIALSDDNENALFVGDGMSSVYCWGAQLETGSQPTSYIPTATIAVTRNADLVSVPASQSWYNTSEGTFILNSATKQAFTTQTFLTATGSDSVNNFFEIKAQSDQGSFVSNTISVDGVNSLLSTSGASILWNTVFGVGFSYSADSTLMGALGSSGTAMNGVNMPTIQSIQLGQDHAGNVLFSGHVTELRYYPVSMSASDLNTLTQ